MTWASNAVGKVEGTLAVWTVRRRMSRWRAATVAMDDRMPHAGGRPFLIMPGSRVRVPPLLFDKARGATGFRAFSLLGASDGAPTGAPISLEFWSCAG